MARDVLVAAFGPSDMSERWMKPLVESILKNGRNLGRLVVAGQHTPIWLPESVVRFPIPPMVARGSRHDNAIDCIMKIIESGVIKSEFLYAPPGSVLSGETDLDSYPVITGRDRILSVGDMIRQNKGGAVITRNRMILSDTRKALERNGYPAVDYSGPHLVYIDPSDAAEAKRVWLEEPHGEFGYDAASLFGNVRAKRLELQKPEATEGEA